MILSIVLFIPTYFLYYSVLLKKGDAVCHASMDYQSWSLYTGTSSVSCYYGIFMDHDKYDMVQISENSDLSTESDKHYNPCMLSLHVAYQFAMVALQFL